MNLMLRHLGTCASLADMKVSFARELAMRDSYAADLSEYRPWEHEVSREQLPGGTRKRADLFTVDFHNVLRIWEFKVVATASAVGQLLVYLALVRRHYQCQRVIRPVLAAATFDLDVPYAIEALGLGIEVVRLPAAVLNAGKVPFAIPDSTPPFLF